jgi:HEPN domain-containing protein
MNELTREWVQKAENDFKLAHLALEAGDEPLTEGACFHAQQCAEKYLKAVLQEHQISFPRRHELIPLLELLLPLDENFESLRQALIELESYAVAVRYPGVTVSVALAQSALAAASKVRDFMHTILQI